jgi:cellulose synthase/poly-beta-1,6-N-acetylglucosamine synthase-like glycosyltransferase
MAAAGRPDQVWSARLRRRCPELLQGTGGVVSYLFWFALLALLITAAGAIEIVIGSRRIRYLREIELLPEADLPKVSLVIAARNEAAAIRPALETLLRQEGVPLDILVVNDRSEDDTGAIARRIAEADPRVRVIDTETLPEGWLGKNHALHLGAADARSKWLLFTDGDVMMSPTAVARAVSYAEREKLDMLAVAPELRMPTPLANLFAGTFVLLFYQYARPWLARRKSSRRHIGVGAFNLIRTSVYRAVGGHSRIPLRPDDDMALGKVVKLAGFAQDALHGTDAVIVTWYTSLREAVLGLEKNAFTGLKYSLTAVVAACLAILLFGVGPWIGVFATSGPTQLLFLGCIVTSIALYVDSTSSSGADPRFAPAFPIALVVFCYIIARAALLAVTRGEVRWRGRGYPLDQLRRNRI